MNNILIIIFRYCKFDGVLDQFTALANIDVPYLSDRATRIGFALFNGELNGLMADAQAYFGGSIPDYYNGCMQFSSLLQYFTDQNVNN